MTRPPLDGTVLITGASAGIGAELARVLAARAKHLVLVARRRERLEALQQELKDNHPKLTVTVSVCDLGDLAATASWLDGLEAQVGPIDVLVNNAGFGDQSVFAAADWDKLQRMVQLNITSLSYLCHRLVPPMLRRGRGGVLNVSSFLGHSYLPGLAVYSGSKHFVTGFTSALRAETKGTGVVVSQVCPGPVATEFGSVSQNRTGTDPPGWFVLDVTRCARQTVAGFARGKAVITPGWLNTLALRFTLLTPAPVLRFVLGMVGRRMRRAQGW